MLDMVFDFEVFLVDLWVVGYSGSFSFDFEILLVFQGLVLSFYFGDEWMMQGVDIVFFDGLFF